MASKILVKRGTAAPIAAALTQYELAVDTTNKRTYIGAADGSGILVGFGTATSAEMASIVTDETGSGKLVFGTSPEITTSLTTASASFDLLNTTVRTLNIGGVATTINILGTTDAAALATYTINIGNAILTPTVGTTTKIISIGGDAATPSNTKIILGGKISGGTPITSPGTIAVTIFGSLDVSQTTALFMPNSFAVGTSPLEISGTPISMASPGESFIRDTAGNGLNIGDNPDGAPIKIGDYAGTFGSGTLVTIDASLETIYLEAANGTSVDGGMTLFGTLSLDTDALISSPSATAKAIKSTIPAGTGVTPTVQIICPSAAVTLLNQTATQPVFGTTHDTITLQASTTYMFEGQYLLTNGTTSHTTAMSFVLTTATMTNCTWTTATTMPTALNTTTSGNATAIFNSVTGGVLNGTSANPNTLITFKGIMRVNAGGTMVPNIAFSAAPGGTNTTLVGSYLKFYPIGSNTINFVGSAIG